MTDKITILCLGPPGTGKSWFAASIAESCDRVLLLATKARETKSVGYRRDNITAEIYEDSRWRPTLDQYEADAHLQLLRRLDGLQADDEYDAVIVDPFTDAVINIEHEICKLTGTASIGDMNDSRSAYKSLKDKAKELAAAGLALAYAGKKPKHVIFTMHVQPPKEDQQVGGTTKPSSDKVARGIEYEGSVLPMMDGGYRRSIAGDFDLVVYTGLDMIYKKERHRQGPWYYLQVSPDRDRHSKIAIGVSQAEKIDNNFKALMEAIK